MRVAPASSRKARAAELEYAIDSAVADRSWTIPERKATTSYPPMATQVMNKAATQGTVARRSSLRRTDRFCRTFGICAARSLSLVAYMLCLVFRVVGLQGANRA